jgi:hypothetical protein
MNVNNYLSSCGAIPAGVECSMVNEVPGVRAMDVLREFAGFRQFVVC